MRRVGLALGLAAGVAVALFLVFRGGAESAQAAVQRSAGATLEAGSSRFELSETPPPGESWPDGDMAADGVMDYVHGRGRITFGPMELLLDGDVVYAKGQGGLTGSRWLRSEGNVADPLDVTDAAMRNPGGVLDLLTGAGADVREVGEATVRGVAVRHYEGTLDLQRVVDGAPAARRAELQDTLDFLAADEPTAVPFGLWVDDEGRARRLRVDGDDGTATTIEYWDFGTPVQLDLPSGDEVMGMDEYMRAVEQAARSSGCLSDTFGDPQTGAAGEDTWLSCGTLSGEVELTRP